MKLYVESPSRYKIARGMLVLATVFGWAVIVIGTITMLASLDSLSGLLYWSTISLPMSGLFILISVEFAKAALDTADSTRRIHELLASTLVDTMPEPGLDTPDPLPEPEPSTTSELDLEGFGPAER